MDKPLPKTEDFVMISDDRVLQQQCRRWLDLPFLALDTEFMRVDSFYPKLALLQVNDGMANYLIDPLGIRDWDAFRQLMQQDSITKVFHSCSEDLLLFLHAFGILPAPLFDTQIANAFLNQGYAVSYQKLVAEQTGVDIPKGETRSDWLQRPLSEQQLRYAALDVAYLPGIYQQQCERLIQLNRLEWVQQDCALLLNNYREEQTRDFSQTYLSFGSAWQLDPRQLAVLQAIAEWREKRARQRDKPKNWIIRDKALFGLARLMPESREQLLQVDEINANFVHYEGSQVLELINNVRNTPEEKLPAQLSRPLTDGQKKIFRKIRRQVEAKAESLSLPVELVGRKRILLELFENCLQLKQIAGDGKVDPASLDLPQELRGWRRDVLLQELLEIML